MKNRFIRYTLTAFFLLAGIAFLVKFASPALLKLYLETGLGNCRKIPIFCVKPDSEIINPPLNEEYLYGLPYCELYEIQICVPENFKVIKQKVTLRNYKNKAYKREKSTIYLLFEKPKFFVNLFPEARKVNIQDDYEFLARIMNAHIDAVRNLTDVFFVIMKGVFTPDLGDQKNVKIVKLKTENLRGFVSFNLSESGNYFDCNLIDNENNFFKVYIKDKEKQLDMDKVITLISTMKKVE